MDLCLEGDSDLSLNGYPTVSFIVAFGNILELNVSLVRAGIDMSLLVYRSVRSVPTFSWLGLRKKLRCL